MIPELGQFASALALSLAIALASLPLLGAQTGNTRLMATARPLAVGQFVFIVIAFACLTIAFIQNDFSVLYVVSNSNSALPLQYRIAAVWGAHEGSLLLWALILSGWTMAVAAFSQSLPAPLLARVLAILGWVSVGFLAFMLFTSNPFDRLIPAALDGNDLNPLLQDFGLVIHPPMLYMGYVGFSVAFAFAVAALIGGRMDAIWARWTRPWTTIAWLFLTLGIALGSWWAYYELGWGGWWFWDPVENASFMPWLTGTALIHSLAVAEKRGALKHWTLLLAICAFALSLLGTFLVRSGVLVSVHAFATDPERGSFILGLFAVLIGGALVLYAWRAPKIVNEGRFGGAAREVWLIVNNVLLVVATATVLLGTLYPLVADALGLGKLSVGPPYFNAVFAPIMVLLLAAVGFGVASRWKQDGVKVIAGRLKWAMLAGVVLGIAIPMLVLGKLGVVIAVGTIFGSWAIASALWEPLYRVRQFGSVSRGLRSVPRHLWGMTLAHMGLGVTVIGVTLVSSYSVERDLAVKVGESVEIGDYAFRFDGVQNHRGPNYDARRATIAISENGEPLTVLYPEKRIYNVDKNPMTEAGIDAGLFRDLYVSLGEPLGEGTWSLRLQYKPFVRWIWLGAIFMALGGLLAVTDRRYRIKVKQDKAAAVTPPAAEAVHS